MPEISAERRRMNPRLLFRVAAKNAIKPFRRLIFETLSHRHARFDRKAGIRTIGVVALDDLGLSSDRSVRCEAMPINFFHSVLASLNLDYSTTVFIDLGCERGRILVLASCYPFRSIIGVELSGELRQIAIENVQRYRSEHPGTPEISVVGNVVDEFRCDGCVSADHVLVYMYNPCKPPVLSAALHNLAQLAGRGVWITIVCANPADEEIVGNAPWLKEMRRGETLDESGGFMSYVIYCSLPQPWKLSAETLVFRFGSWTLGKWSFKSVSNTTSPLTAESGSVKLPAIFQPTTYQQMRDDGTISRALGFDRNAIRYVAYRGKRYFIDLRPGSFAEYLGKFSAKTRNTLKRKVGHFARHSGGLVDLRYYRSPEEMTEFCSYAIAISRLSYQAQIGFGFPETEEFRTHLIAETAEGRVCGFVLMHLDRPVAYVFCRIASGIISYIIPGYDPEFTRFSPGTVLLYTMLERLFAEREFEKFDFGGQAWEYKALFATGSVDYLRVIWLPITAKNLSLVTAHYLGGQAWRIAAWAKGAVGQTIRGKGARKAARPHAIRQ